jgi:hypothetical protein
MVGLLMELKNADVLNYAMTQLWWGTSMRCFPQRHTQLLLPNSIAPGVVGCLCPTCELPTCISVWPPAAFGDFNLDLTYLAYDGYPNFSTFIGSL